MIAPLRRRHRLLSGTLLILVPVLYVVALAARPEVPVQEPLPTALQELFWVETVHEQLDVYGGFPVQTRAGRASDSRGDGAPPAMTWALELAPGRAIPRPEVLVYWTPSPAGGVGIPDGAFLLGSLAGERPRILELPDAVLGREGHLVLYSLGHREILGSSSLPAVGEAEPPPAAAQGDAS